jgi:hypothetical protein
MDTGKGVVRLNVFLAGSFPTGNAQRGAIFN